MLGGEGTARGLVQAGVIVLVQGFPATGFPDELVEEEAQDGEHHGRGPADEGGLVALPEEPEAIFGVRVLEIIVDDHEVTVVSARGLFLVTIVRHGG
jgi:hypothetical protein